MNNTFLKVYIDGASWGNPGKCSIGIVIKDNWSDNILEHSEMIGKGTNNFAEFSAFSIALTKLLFLEFNEDEIEFFSDSKLLVDGINKKYNFKKTPPLNKLMGKIRNKLKMLEKPYSVIYIPRESNFEADLLTKKCA